MARHQLRERHSSNVTGLGFKTVICKLRKYTRTTDLYGLQKTRNVKLNAPPYYCYREMLITGTNKP